MSEQDLLSSFIKWAWHEVGQYMLIAFFVILAVLVKILYHSNKWLMNNLPESCALIILGIAGGIMFTLPGYANVLPQFTPELFNFILLPPIVLDSSYDLDDPAFYANLGTILTFAVIGTLLNIVFVVSLMFAAISVGFVNLAIIPVELFIFSAIVAAVDPVAVSDLIQFHLILAQNSICLLINFSSNLIPFH